MYAYECRYLGMYIHCSYVAMSLVKVIDCNHKTITVMKTSRLEPIIPLKLPVMPLNTSPKSSLLYSKLLCSVAMHY